MIPLVISFLISIGFITFNVLSIVSGTHNNTFHFIALIIFVFVGIWELILIIKELRKSR